MKRRDRIKGYAWIVMLALLGLGGLAARYHLWRHEGEPLLAWDLFFSVLALATAAFFFVVLRRFERLLNDMENDK